MGAPTPQGGRQHMILPKFPKNYMKLKEFGPPGGGGATHPKFYYVDLPLPSLSRVNVLENLFLFKLLIKRELYKKFECIIIKYK